MFQLLGHLQVVAVTWQMCRALQRQVLLVFPSAPRPVKHPPTHSHLEDSCSLPPYSLTTVSPSFTSPSPQPGNQRTSHLHRHQQPAPSEMLMLINRWASPYPRQVRAPDSLENVSVQKCRRTMGREILQHF